MSADEQLYTVRLALSVNDATRQDALLLSRWITFVAGQFVDASFDVLIDPPAEFTQEELAAMDRELALPEEAAGAGAEEEVSSAVS